MCECYDVNGMTKLVSGGLKAFWRISYYKTGDTHMTIEYRGMSNEIDLKTHLMNISSRYMDTKVYLHGYEHLRMVAYRGDIIGENELPEYSLDGSKHSKVHRYVSKELMLVDICSDKNSLVYMEERDGEVTAIRMPTVAKRSKMDDEYT